MSKTLEKYIIKIVGINLSYSKEFNTLLISSKLAWFDMITYSCKQCLSKLLGIVTKALNSLWMTCRCTYIITGWLPEDTSHISRLDDNN